ncbi:MAG: potassium transporter Kup [Acidimicrobiales bacterium]|nr:potassium transporter Kup [Acidimicrobiales bacterium]
MVAAEQSHSHTHSGRTAGLALAALGIVYGDIGTSPLYAMRESFEGAGHQLDVIEPNVLGVLSLVLWSLIIVITIKYLLVVMRADNEGEGGILALTALIPKDRLAGRARWVFVMIGLFGTALLYGDGMITPAISVLSAVEGTEVATDRLGDYVLPIAIVILVGLFVAQRRGTGSVGRVFGPVMVVWFVTLGGLGLVKILDEPGVLRAVSPTYAVQFFADNAWTGFFALGSVFLVVTGGEALYADMGHFGRRPIAIGWFALVLPGLMLNYFGQGALLLNNPEAIDNPFYRMAPSWGTIPLVVLATLATVIASQALISGAFSLTVQAMQLGYTPRMKVKHTSASEIGQIYVPAVNWALMVACIALVLGFRSSTSLAAAYGLAVTMTMVITTVLFYVVARHASGWSRRAAGALCGAFLVVDIAFLGANIPKVPHGGWFPLVIGGLVFTLLTTWHTGRDLVRQRLRSGETPLAAFIDSAVEHRSTRVPGTAVYLFSRSDAAPPALVANMRSTGVLHRTLYVVSVITDPVPRVHPVRRVERTVVGHGVSTVQLHYGFMEQPNVPRDLAQHAGVEHLDTTYFLGRESVLVTDRPGMAMWREHLYAVLYRNATSAASYFNLPPDRTVEVGMQVEL